MREMITGLATGLNVSRRTGSTTLRQQHARTQKTRHIDIRAGACTNKGSIQQTQLMKRSTSGAQGGRRQQRADRTVSGAPCSILTYCCSPEHFTRRELYVCLLVTAHRPEIRKGQFFPGLAREQSRGIARERFFFARSRGPW